MACHLAGVTTAVASCGTAFGEDHTRVLRRFLHDHEEFRGEVIFTFDGDAAGQNAALKTFQGDQRFVAQTYVAVEPDGLDPCDVRIQKGDAAVRDLVARRVPLYRFVLSNVVAQFDLDRADGRVAAVREAAKLVTSSRDASVVNSSYARDIAALTGMDPVDVQAEVRRAASSAGRTSAGSSTPAGPATEPPARGAVPDLRHPRFSIERETLKLVIQAPMAIGRTTADIGANDFTHPVFRAVWELVAAAGGTVAGSDDPGWATRLRDAADDPAVSSAITALAVEPLMKAPDAAYVGSYVFKLLELTAQRRIADLKSRLQRTNPVDEAADYNRMFGELAALEQHRRTLRDHIAGSA
jgi:DNA primase